MWGWSVKKKSKSASKTEKLMLNGPICDNMFYTFNCVPLQLTLNCPRCSFLEEPSLHQSRTDWARFSLRAQLGCSRSKFRFPKVLDCRGIMRKGGNLLHFLKNKRGDLGVIFNSWSPTEQSLFSPAVCRQHRICQEHRIPGFVQSFLTGLSSFSLLTYKANSCPVGIFMAIFRPV